MTSGTAAVERLYNVVAIIVVDESFVMDNEVTSSSRHIAVERSRFLGGPWWNKEPTNSQIPTDVPRTNPISVPCVWWLVLGWGKRNS